MNKPQGWDRVEGIFEAALERAPEERAAFIRTACGGDQDLYAEVESLLTAHDEAGSFLEKPAASGLADAASERPADVRAVLTPGDRLGPYEIADRLGRGGMGEVYKARDTRLGRIVAVKVLAAQRRGETEFRQRMEREARALAALSHPHICPIFDVGRQDDTDFLVMEYLEGQTLAERLKKGVLPLDQTLKFAVQIAEALDVAHRHGIVHRDLKPSNVMLTKAGAKLLDFGIAAIRPLKVQLDAATTCDRTLSAESALIGTLQYMAPERLEGREADARSDLFAFGATLYEMLTGHRAFVGESDSRVIAAVLDSEPPPVRTLQPLTPPALERLVGTCLAKDPDNRWQNAGDLARELRWIAETVGTASKPSNTVAIPHPDTSEPSAGNLVGSNERSRRVLYALGGLTVAAVLLAGVVGLFYRTGTGSPAGSPAAYTQLTDFTDSAVAPSLSPDGRMVTFIRDGLPFLSSGQVYVKLLPNGEPVRLTNDKERKFGPVFTPDGSRVAYSRVEFGKNPSWDTWTVPVPGGQPTRLLPNATGLTWLNSGRILFSEIKGVSLHMGIVTSTESRADRREIYFPAHERAMAHYSWASPDRRWILIVEMDRTGAFSQPCRLVPFDGASVGREVGPQGRCTSAGWSPDGAWMYFSAYVGGTSHIWRQRFPDGPPEQMTFGPTEEEGVTVAPDGRSLITSLGLRQSAIWIHDPSGERPVSSEGFAFSPTLSRDGNRVFYLTRQNSTPPFIELQSIDRDSGKLDRVLPGYSVSDYKISPDEKEVAFTTLEGEPQIWVATIDRRAPPRPIVKGGDQVSFGGNGKLIFRKLGDRVNLLFQINRDGSGLEQISPTPILGIRQVSPDGDSVIVEATRASEDETPGNSVVRVRDGASQRICAQCSAHWSPDGKLFYLVSSGPVERTAAISLPPGIVLPQLPIPGMGPANWAKLPGVTIIERALFPGTGDLSTFVFVKQDFRRNLFQIPLQ